jgi:hypothetical protein
VDKIGFIETNALTFVYYIMQNGFWRTIQSTNYIFRADFAVAFLRKGNCDCNVGCYYAPDRPPDAVAAITKRLWQYAVHRHFVLSERLKEPSFSNYEASKPIYNGCGRLFPELV